MSLVDRIRKNPRLAALLQIDDTAHSIALGAAVGMFVALTPTVGIQMYIAALICLVLRCNRLWAIAMVWISNPLTMIPMYYGFYVLGCLLLDLERLYNFEKFKEIFDLILEVEGFLTQLKSFAHQMLELGMEMAWPMFFGGLILGAALSVPTYFFVFWAVKSNRSRNS